MKFPAEDYAYTADLLRRHAAESRRDLFRAVCSNNVNVILSALDIAASVAEPGEDAA